MPDAPRRRTYRWEYINRYTSEYDEFVNRTYYGSHPTAKPYLRTSRGGRHLDHLIESGLERVGVENKYFRVKPGTTDVDVGVVKWTAKRQKMTETLRRIRKQALKDRELLLEGILDRVEWNLNANYRRLERWLKHLGMDVHVRPMPR